MAIWSWYGQLALGRLYNAAEFLDVGSYIHLMDWTKKIDARKTVQRGAWLIVLTGNYQVNFTKDTKLQILI